MTDSLSSDEPQAIEGDPIPSIFPPDDPMARFVVSMSMAKNDIERAFLDMLRSHDEDGQDFTYRVRVSIGHLVEAIDALNAYSQKFPEVRALMARVPAEAQKDLRIVRGTLQRAGAEVLQCVRDNSFHYPSPDPNYSPTSDEQLEGALAGMGNRSAEFHVDGDTREVRLTFADDAAIGLAMGAATDEEVRQRMEIARDGALAFRRWADALLATYLEVSGHTLGEPIVTSKQVESA